jgi:hypothetical protein
MKCFVSSSTATTCSTTGGIACQTAPQTKPPRYTTDGIEKQGKESLCYTVWAAQLPRTSVHPEAMAISRWKRPHLIDDHVKVLLDARVIHGPHLLELLLQPRPQRHRHGLPLPLRLLDLPRPPDVTSRVIPPEPAPGRNGVQSNDVASPNPVPNIVCLRYEQKVAGRQTRVVVFSDGSHPMGTGCHFSVDVKRSTTNLQRHGFDLLVDVLELLREFPIACPRPLLQEGDVVSQVSVLLLNGGVSAQPKHASLSIDKSVHEPEPGCLLRLTFWTRRPHPQAHTPPPQAALVAEPAPAA